MDPPLDLRAEVARWCERQGEDRRAFGRLLCNCLSGACPRSDPCADWLADARTATLVRGELVRVWFRLVASQGTLDDLPQFNRLWPDPQRLAADLRLESGEPGRPTATPLPTRAVPAPADIATVMTRLVEADPRACDRAAVGAAAIVEQWRGSPLPDDGLEWWQTVRRLGIASDATISRWFEQVRLGRCWRRIRQAVPAAPVPAATSVLLTTEAAAVRAGVAPKTLNNWVSTGRVPPSCITGNGRARRFKTLEFDQWLRHRTARVR